jgi:hypothetical protein
MRNRHLGELDGAAVPRALVVRWLADGHAFPTLSHYAEWLLGQPAFRWPFVSLPARAAARARRMLRRSEPYEIERTVGDAAAETTFLVELVLLINAVTDDWALCWPSSATTTSRAGERSRCG